MNESTTISVPSKAQVREFVEHDPSRLNKGEKQSHNKHLVYFAEHQSETSAMLKSRGAK